MDYPDNYVINNTSQRLLSSYYLPGKPKYDIKILLVHLKAQLNTSCLGKLSLAFQAKFATPASDVH